MSHPGTITHGAEWACSLGEGVVKSVAGVDFHQDCRGCVVDAAAWGIAHRDDPEHEATVEVTEYFYGRSRERHELRELPPRP